LAISPFSTGRKRWKNEYTNEMGMRLFSTTVYSCSKASKERYPSSNLVSNNNLPISLSWVLFPNNYFITFSLLFRKVA
jgi:hypothetical protein